MYINCCVQLLPQTNNYTISSFFVALIHRYFTSSLSYTKLTQKATKQVLIVSPENPKTFGGLSPVYLMSPSFLVLVHTGSKESRLQTSTTSATPLEPKC